MSEFNEATKLGYNKKMLQNKYNDLKRQYFNWRDSHMQSGLGRDPVTGEVTADPSWFGEQTAESSQQTAERFKRPQCCDQLITILGRTPRDRGELFAAGGHEPDQTPPSASPQTPEHSSDEPIPHRSSGQSSKRLSRDNSVNSPRKKSIRTTSIDDTIEDLNDVIRSVRKHQGHEDAQYAVEIAQVKEILEADGYKEEDVVFMQALNLCLNKHRRRAFLDLKTKEGRLNWVKVSWDFAALNSK